MLRLIQCNYYTLYKLSYSSAIVPLHFVNCFSYGKKSDLQLKPDSSLLNNSRVSDEYNQRYSDEYGQSNDEYDQS